MKICLIMGGDEDGGLESHFVDVSNALASHHEVHVIAHPKYEKDFHGVIVHSMDMTKSRRNLMLLLNIIGIIRRIKPDLIHAQANKAVAIIASLKPLLPKKSRYVATLHNMKRNLKAYMKFDSVIGVSARIMGHLEHPKKTVIYNGIKSNKSRLKDKGYIVDQAGIDDGGIVLIALARLVPAKRMDVLLDAFVGITGAKLVIVGDGSDKQQLQAKAEELKLDEVSFLGHRQDNVELLSSADICVISSDREGFPYVLVESLLARTTMISTDVSDVKKILPLHAVVDQGDSKALHEVIQESVDDFDTFSEDYEPVFEWARQNLTFEHMMQEIEKVYSETLNANA